MPQPIVLVCSVELELRPLLPYISAREPMQAGCARAWTGELENRSIIALATGMGKTNAGHALTAVLEKVDAEGVLGFGVAGAYRASGLAVGDVAIADTEHYGDEGVAAPDHWISCEGIGIPLVETKGRTYFNDFRADPALVRFAGSALAGSGIEARVGAFVTVSCCSGTGARGDELARRFGAICETMEGAAYAHVAALYAIPFLELRGISNLIENRDTTRWKLHEAADAAARSVAAAVRAWPAGPGRESLGEPPMRS